VFDDASLVAGNPYIKSSKYISKVFQKDLWDFAYEGNKPNYYRPLQTLSFMLDYRLWRLVPQGYHLTNTFLHFFNALLVFGIIYLFFNNFFVAFLSSLFFSIHPVNSSTVAYISGRGDLLAGTFILSASLSTGLALKFIKNRKLYFISAVLFSFLAFLSRESALVIPLLVILLYCFIPREKRTKTPLLLFIVLSASLYLYFRLVVLSIPLIRPPLFNLAPFLKMLNFLYLSESYIFLLIIPANLYLTHTAVPILSWSDPRAGVTLILFIACLILWYVKRHNKILNFSLTWFFIFVLQVILVMTGFSRNKLCMAENWIYIAAIGFYLIISYLFYILWLRHKTAAYCLIAVMFLTYTAITISSNANFKDRVSLARQMLRFDFENEEAHKELANAYLEKKEYASALEHIGQAIKLAPLDPDLYMLKGAYYEDTGNIKLAVNAYEELLKIEPNSARARNNLGAIYFNQGLFDKARIFLEQAIKLNPLLAEPYLNMAKLCQNNNQTPEAVFFYQRTINLNPDFNEAFVNLAKIYLNKRDFNGALVVLNKALYSGHQDDPVLMLLGITNAELGFDTKASYYFSKLFKSGHHTEEMMLNLGIFYANRGQLNRAMEFWQEGLRKNPGNKIINANIDKAKVLLRQGKL